MTVDRGLAHFESEAQEISFAHHLRHGSIPLKYAYAGTAAETHQTLARSTGYADVVGEVDRELTLLDRLTVALDIELAEACAAVAEIGPGDGYRSAALFHHLVPSRVPAVRYLALDFSRTLMDSAATRLATLPGLTVTTAEWDVETARSDAVNRWREQDTGVLVLLLGSTLGNFDSPADALGNIRSSLRRGDILLVGATLKPRSAPENGVLEPYLTEVFRNALLEPLRAAGADVDRCRVTMSFDGDAVLGDVEIGNDFSFRGTTVRMGTVLRCFRSRRFTEAGLDALLSGADLTPVTRVADAEAAHVTVAATIR